MSPLSDSPSPVPYLISPVAVLPGRPSEQHISTTTGRGGPSPFFKQPHVYFSSFSYGSFQNLHVSLSAKARNPRHFERWHTTTQMVTNPTRWFSTSLRRSRLRSPWTVSVSDPFSERIRLGLMSMSFQRGFQRRTSVSCPWLELQATAGVSESSSPWRGSPSGQESAS